MFNMILYSLETVVPTSRIAYIPQKTFIVAFLTFPSIVLIALIVGIVKKPYHNNITAYAVNVTKISQMNLFPF
jgi:hypothetical protein